MTFSSPKATSLVPGAGLKRSITCGTLRHDFVTFDLTTALDRLPDQGGAGDSACLNGNEHSASTLLGQQRVSDVFQATVRRHGPRTALTLGTRPISYSLLGQWSQHIAHYLLSDSGFQVGDRVALMLENGPEFIAAYYGVLSAGGVVVPVPPNIEWSRLQRITHLCGIRRTISSRSILARRSEVTLGDCAVIDPTISLSAQVPPVKPLRIEGQSLAMILFTSGSSGEPKGVMLSDGNILANTWSILQYLPIRPDDRALALLPFYHAFGLSILQTHLLSGAMVVVDGNMMFPNSVVDALEQHRATSFSAVPEGYYSLLTFAELGKRPLPHLRYMSVAGGALKSEAVVDVAQRIAPADFYVMYGQTEATARLTYLPAALAEVRPSSIGRAIAGVEARVLDSDDREVPDGETGELCARGANVMLGYWNDPQATQGAIRGGWLHTGDLAIRDTDGFFYVHARKNELVKVQGFRVHPREVEEVVARHFPSLRIIVVPYPQQGATRLALFAISGTSSDALVEQIRLVCLRELPRYKIPSHIELLTHSPLNASMKLDRAALAQRAAQRSQRTPLRMPPLGA